MLRTAPLLPYDRAFDAGLRPRLFPDEAASLLPGLLAATRTGLTPASNDELTNTDEKSRVTGDCYARLCGSPGSETSRGRPALDQVVSAVHDEVLAIDA
jgi:hypothetical protein